MATIKEVARKAGVSVGTVSNVLRGSKRVSADVRERVEHAIRALDYHPNQIARSLKTRQTRLLGIVVSDIANPFFPQMVRGAEDAALKHGYLLIASNTDDQVEREKRVMAVLRTQRVDGILLVVAPNDTDSAHIRNTLDSKIPLVCLDRIPQGLRVHSIATDAVHGAEMCMRHLISLGHRRIGIITGNLLLQTAQDRLQECPGRGRPFDRTGPDSDRRLPVRERVRADQTADAGRKMSHCAVCGEWHDGTRRAEGD